MLLKFCAEIMKSLNHRSWAENKTHSPRPTHIY